MIQPGKNKLQPRFQQTKGGGDMSQQGQQSQTVKMF